MTNDKPIFVKCGKERIKISNIKSYGISTETMYFQKVYEIDDDSSFWGKLLSSWVYKGKTFKIDEYLASVLNYSSSGYIRRKLFSPEKGYYDENPGNLDTRAPKSDLITKNVEYLYITTYQDDNYIFYEDNEEFNIHEKCKELDKWLS